MSTRRSPVFWTDEEAEQLAKAAWIARPPQERLDPLGWARYVSQAQAKVLPNERRKHIAGMHMIKPVMTFIKQLQAHKDASSVSAVNLEPVNPAVRAVVDEFEQARRAQLNNEPLSGLRREPAHQATLDRIAEQMKPRGLDHTEIRMIANIVLDAIEERVRGYFIRHPPIASADEPQATTAPEAPSVAPSSEPARQNIDWNKQLQSVQEVARQHLRIGVVGFDAREQEQIARGLNQKVKLTFAYPHHHSRSSKLIDKVAGCNAIFVRVKWTSHAHIAALKKQLSTKCHFLENQPNAIKCADVINEWLKYTQAR